MKHIEKMESRIFCHKGHKSHHKAKDSITFSFGELIKVKISWEVQSDKIHRMIQFVDLEKFKIQIKVKQMLQNLPISS